MLILNGEPINEPIASYGPFVMNTRVKLNRLSKIFTAENSGILKTDIQIMQIMYSPDQALSYFFLI